MNLTASERIQILIQDELKNFPFKNYCKIADQALMANNLVDALDNYLKAPYYCFRIL